MFHHSILPPSKQEREMRRTEVVAKNKTAIITILAKEIAVTLRKKFPNLHIKAHPLQWDNAVRLALRQIEADESMQVDCSPQGRETNTYRCSVKLQRKDYQVPRRKCPAEFVLSLDNPDSVTEFEGWLDKIIQRWFYPDNNADPQQ